MSARKRHRTVEGPSQLQRPLVAATTRAGLPTIAAIASALAIVAAASPAAAIVSSKDTGTEEPESDAATDAESDGGDAAYCPPNPDGPALGGVPAYPYPRVHGTGCGCSGSHDDDETATAFAAAAVVAVFRQLRRQSPSSGGRNARSTTSGSKRN